ncbi:MAG TPA: hypothetical protein VF498_06320 [Anaerolineales bacterium]
MSRWKLWLLAILGLIVLAIGLAEVSSGFQGLDGLLPFLGTLLLGAAILLVGWWALQGEAAPRWLLALMVGAAVLRLAAGAVWFVALPRFAHGSPSEKAGYIMSDANERDQTAWRLGHSSKSLWQAFEIYRKADQYGGLLFLSALVYRYLGGPFHQPLQMVVVTASFSALALLFAWAFARRAWGEKAAGLTAWILALYPEAILLGSSQMREAFLITLGAAAFYGLVRYSQDRSWAGLAWIGGALLLSLPLTPALAAILLVMLVLTTLVMAKTLFGERFYADWRLWLVVAGLLGLGLLTAWFSWEQFSPRGRFDLVALATLWLRKSGEYQAYLSKHASGWIQKIFHSTPDWAHLPLLMIYGVVQPFLPATLIATSEAPIYRFIQPWRGIGWTLLLPFLIYAPLKAWFGKGTGGFAKGLSLAVWVSILTAAYRGGADGWDNPRYRVAFAALQVALVAWVLVEQRRAPDPWLRRALVCTGLVLAWFVPWYLQRYLQLQVYDVFKTLGLGLASAALYLIWDWARTARTSSP